MSLLSYVTALFDRRGFVVDGHGYRTALNYCVKAKKTKTRSIRYTGYQNSVQTI